jgi:hypothetical protein
MGQTLFFENTRTKRRFQIIALDKSVTPNRVTLKGQYREFTEDYDKKKIQDLGYVLVREETPDD